MVRPILVLLGAAAVCSSARAWAGEPQPAASPEAVRRSEEITVVSASRTDQFLSDAPVSMSVITDSTIATSQATNCAELLRDAPGVNVIQLSAREFDLTSRQSTSTLPNSQLALLDGRSIYLDFFGLILWDFLPADLAEVKQVEVVRGPASAVWGANALTGVVNILTKSPRESAGTNVVLSGGLFGRRTQGAPEMGLGASFASHVRWARAPSERWSYKVSAGYFHSDALPRPVGQVPLDHHPLIPELEIGGGTLLPFANTGTDQPKLDVRVDQTLGLAETLSYSAGFAGTSGIVHTGVGPFDIQPGSYMAYGRVAYTRGRLRASAFVNLVDVQAPSLLMKDALTGRPVQLDFETQTYDLELGHSTLIGAHQLLTFGGNVRRNAFDITLAPAGRDRSEIGAYFQDEAYWRRLRVTLSARLDKFGNLEKVAFSPRLAAQLLLSQRHSLRLSYNRAFRAPSLLNNYLDLTIEAADGASAVCSSLPALCAGLDPSTISAPLGPRAMGSEVARTLNPALPRLKQESLTAYEAAYNLNLGRTRASMAFYLNDTDDNVNFVADPETLVRAGLPAFYSSRNPPPGWPFPLWLLDSPSPFSTIPAVNAYMNLGPYRNRGLELSVDHELSRGLAAAVNYSWQDRPRSLTAAPDQIPFPLVEHSVPPKHRVNARLSLTRGRWLGSLSAHYVARAFWNDVLPSLNLVGYTPAFTLIDGSLGVRWRRGRLTTLVKAHNLLNQEIRQHLFGDVVKRAVMIEARLSL